MKAMLLSLGYCGIDSINFPVEVDLNLEVWGAGKELYTISTDEIVRIGGNESFFIPDDNYPLIEEEFKLI